MKGSGTSTRFPQQDTNDRSASGQEPQEWYTKYKAIRLTNTSYFNEVVASEETGLPLARLWPAYILSEAPERV